MCKDLLVPFARDKEWYLKRQTEISNHRVALLLRTWTDQTKHYNKMILKREQEVHVSLIAKEYKIYANNINNVIYYYSIIKYYQFCFNTD